ncbi:lytic transglycosylase domain-containing protein [Pantoea ananatis]|uniref:lytic transglycosylase domain-containing protein n=1 Tax=Pantoea ananas TaxID=553 RepID=UPI001B302E91|nr:lytic transglycosylase domain-containing protein [Pantoea ananatis]
MTPSALLALATACAPSVHPDTAHDVARVESSLNPYAIAEIIPKEKLKPGEKNVISYAPDNLKSALRITRQIQDRKHRYSVGLMQITSTNFSKYGTDAEDLFSPCKNLSVFEKIITDCYLRGGTIPRALSCYYSGNFITGQKKEKQFSGTSYTGRIGYNQTGRAQYVVPSSKEDRQKSADVLPLTDTPRRIWPKAVIRGAVSQSHQTSPGTVRTLYPANVMRGQVITLNNQAKEITP